MWYALMTTIAAAAMALGVAASFAQGVGEQPLRDCLQRAVMERQARQAVSECLARRFLSENVAPLSNVNFEMRNRAKVFSFGIAYGMEAFGLSQRLQISPEEARQFIASPTGGAVRVGGGPIAQTRIGWGTHARGMGRDSERPDDKARGETMRMAAQSYEFNLESGLAIVGSPETVIHKLEEGQKRIGYDIFCTNHEIGRMPKQMVRNSIELFGKEVIPAFH